MKNQTAILVLGAGLYHIPLFKKLQNGGYRVIAADKDLNAAGKTYCDVFYAVDIMDIAGILEVVEKEKVEGVMPLNERGIMAAAQVAEICQFRGLPMSCVEGFVDKGIMREKWKTAGLPIPKFEIIDKESELESAANKIGYPLVMKPTDNGGSGRGISIVNQESELKEAYHFALPYINGGRIILEEYFEGTELTVETFSNEGEVFFLAMSDKEKPNIKTRVALSLNYPAAITETQEQIVKKEVRKALAALGLKGGMAHTEVIINQNKMILVETGARGGGGHIFHTIIEAVSGVNAPLLYADWLTGKEIKIGSIEKRGAVYRFLNPEEGILESVEGIEEVKKWPFILDVGMVKKVGDQVGKLENSQHRAGHLIATGMNREEAVNNANAAERKIKFTLNTILK